MTEHVWTIVCLWVLLGVTQEANGGLTLFCLNKILIFNIILYVYLYNSKYIEKLPR